MAKPLNFGFLCFACLWDVSVSGAQTSLATPLYTEGTNRQVQKKLIGVWQQIGYGRVIVIREQGYDLYHTTELLCYRDPTGENLQLDARYSLFDTSRTGNDLTLFFHDLGNNTKRYQNRERFTRLAQLPRRCKSSLSAAEYRSPQFIFDLFWQTFHEQYAFFNERKIDWQHVRNKYRPRIKPDLSDDELFDLLTEILQQLDDGHVHLYLGTQRHFKAGTNTVLERLRQQFQSQTQLKDFGKYVSNWASGLKATLSDGFLESPVHRAANDNIWWDSVNAEIGYINIYLLTNFIKDGGWKSRAQQLELLDKVFDEILQAFQSKSAILLDLSHNQGGFDEATDLIASRFADRERHALTIQPLAVSLDKSDKVFVSPSARVRFTKPVYILTSPITVSAGESLVAMLKTLPNVKQVGETTRGYFSGILNKPLPGGFAISVTNQRIMAPDGRLYEVQGNVPDIPMDVFPPANFTGGYRRALDSTIALMMREIAPGDTKPSTTPQVQ